MNNRQLTGILIACVLSTITVRTSAQVVNNGGAIVISNGAKLVCNKGLTNNAGTVTNSGTLTLGGDLVNTGNVNNNSGSTVGLEGTSLQTISGNVLNVRNLVTNNTSGITLNTDVNVAGTIAFNAGIITTANKLVAFLSGSSFVNSPSDGSHINGNVKFDGTGIFIYPTGNGIKYQPLSVNLSSNSNGLIAVYRTGDAGTGNFTTTGSSTTPLTSYNNREYWILSLPSSGSPNAVGNVIVSWDGYSDAYGNPLTERRIAHKINGNWQNEGGSGAGNTSSGSVTSNNLSTWGTFTLGSVGSILPLKWISLVGKLNTYRQAEINWNVIEDNVLQYELEKSTNGTDYLKLGIVYSKGNGNHYYNFTETTQLSSTAFYRVKQVDKTGSSTYSSIIRIATSNKPLSAFIYPSLVHSSASLNMVAVKDIEQVYTIINAEGKLVKKGSFQLMQGTNILPLNLSDLLPGIYCIVLPQYEGNRTIRFIRL